METMNIIIGGDDKPTCTKLAAAQSLKSILEERGLVVFLHDDKVAKPVLPTRRFDVMLLVSSDASLKIEESFMDGIVAEGVKQRATP